jgi:hypothetical protein
MPCDSDGESIRNYARCLDGGAAFGIVAMALNFTFRSEFLQVGQHPDNRPEGSRTSGPTEERSEQANYRVGRGGVSV